jgi:hypothetical protein
MWERKQCFIWRLIEKETTYLCKIGRIGCVHGGKEIVMTAEGKRVGMRGRVRGEVVRFSVNAASRPRWIDCFRSYSKVLGLMSSELYKRRPIPLRRSLPVPHAFDLLDGSSAEIIATLLKGFTDTSSLCSVADLTTLGYLHLVRCHREYGWKQDRAERRHLSVLLYLPHKVITSLFPYFLNCEINLCNILSRSRDTITIFMCMQTWLSH